MKKYYFAYGSNLNKFQMQFRCTGAKPVGTAMLPGYRLVFKGSKTGSYLTIEEAPGYKVPIGVWDVDSTHEKQLDLYEGFPRFYSKKTMRLKMDGRTVEGFIYIMNDSDYGMPEYKYVRTCRIGYGDFGFNPQYLQDALIYTKYCAGEDELA